MLWRFTQPCGEDPQWKAHIISPRCVLFDAVMPRYLVGLFVVCAAVASGLVDDATEHRELTQSLGPVELSEV